MRIFLLTIGTLLFALGNISQKTFADSSQSSKTAPPLFAFLWFLIVAVSCGLYLSITKSFFFQGSTMILALAAGVCFATGANTAITALRQGALSITILIINFNIIIPIILSSVFLRERLTAAQITGFVLILVVFVIISGGKGEKKQFKLSWLIATLLCCVSNGLQMFMAKLHQSLLPGREIIEYFFLAFMTAALISFVFYLFSKGKEEEEYTYTGKYFYFPAVCTAITLAGGNLLVLALSSMVSSAALFSTFQGGAILATSVISILFFKERPVFKTYLSLIAGIAAIILLNI